MQLKKFFVLIPMFAVGLFLTGCGPDKGTTVIDTGEQQTEQEIQDADSAYETESGKDYENYDN